MAAIAIISSIVGIFLIALCIKIWGATNSVKAIKEQTEQHRIPSYGLQAAKLVALGSTQDALAVLNKDLDNALEQVLSISAYNYNSENAWRSGLKQKWAEILEEKGIVYDDMGLSIPESYKNFDFDRFFKATRNTIEKVEDQSETPYFPPSH